MKFLSFLLFFLCPFLLPSQHLSIKYSIDLRKDKHSISPYIYGTNGQSDDKDENITARRQGGARFTGYNWENNASHAGRNWKHYSDDYLAITAGLDSLESKMPRKVVTSFHDTSLASNCYSLITLPMAGYVAKDKSGAVKLEETAPSPRWVKMINEKNASFLFTPDTNDGVVYMDEMLHFLISKYGKANTINGIKGYELDNETELWHAIHTRLHPERITCGELLKRSIEMAQTIKKADREAKVFGPSLFGFTAYQDYAKAPDWTSYKAKGYKTFIEAYLGEMKKASDSLNLNLLDVLSLHWYSEARGYDKNNRQERVAFTNNSDSGVAAARMQAARTFWDATYKEDSFIGLWYSPVILLPALQKSIQTFNPSVKLAFTEYDFGGHHHISGGIAQADALGLYGQYDVYMANFWGEVSGYISSAFKIYRNYDGLFSTFGDQSIFCENPSPENTSIYASVSSDKKIKKLHLIVINKNFSKPIKGDFLIKGVKYSSVNAWAFNAERQIIKEEQRGDISKGNQFNYIIPPLSVYHFVLKESN